LTCGDFIEKFLAGRGEKVKTPFLLLDSRISAAKFQVDNPQKDIRLKVLTNSESKLRKDFVLFLRSELKPYRILIEPLFLEYHSFLQNLKDHRFDVAVSAFLMDIDYDMKDAFSSASFFNYANFKNPGMDSLLDRGLQELDDEKREKIYMAAHEAWLNELPLIPLFNLYYYIGVSRKIPVPDQTYRIIGGSGDFLFNIEKWVRNTADNRLQ
jgi:ABC-type oligopeptide transport system substrate-binding subunit